MWINRDVDLPQALVSAQRDGRLVVFAGAGVSMGPPSKLTFLRRFGRGNFRRCADAQGGRGSRCVLGASSLVNDVCGPPPVFQLSALIADASEGPSRDRLYFACRQSGGGPVVIVSSKDRGKTWNRPGVPAGPTTVDVMRRVMTLAVNNAGVVGAFIAERRAKTGEACLQFRAASFDGAESFGSPQPVSTSECRESPADDRPA
jgi:hypothetical protein